MPKPPIMQSRLRIGVSSCLLGAAVRYDGNHKYDPYVGGQLNLEFELIPICPEVAIGLGVPRAPIRLSGVPGAPRACGVHDEALDVTTALAEFGAATARELQDISGYIFKSRSPSCGVKNVSVRTPAGETAEGRGIYAQAFMSAHALLPVAEESDLVQPAGRDNFIERVLAYRDLRALLREPSPQRLVEFHTRYKLAVMAHGTVCYRTLGALVADAGARDIALLSKEYAAVFMQALRQRATRKRHTNVLMHVMGYLKTQIDRTAKAQLCASIDAYRLGDVPWSHPVLLLQQYLHRFPNDYLAQQIYLNPYPYASKLRDEV